MKDYSRRPYITEEGYPKAMRGRPAKANFNRVLEQDRSLGEFSSNKPSAERVRQARRVLAQSEFKKPYKDQDYDEMEHWADPPPGIRLDPWRGGGDFPVEIEEGPTLEGPAKAIFDIEPVGYICPGVLSRLDLRPTHRITGVELVFSPPGTEMQRISANAINVLVPESYGGGGLLRIRAYMQAGRKFNNLTGDSVGNHPIGEVSSGRCRRLYLEFSFYAVVYNPGTSAYEAATKYTVFNLHTGTVASGVPNGSGGTVSFPCDDADLVYFRGKCQSVDVANTVSMTNPHDTTPSVHNIAPGLTECFPWGGYSARTLSAYHPADTVQYRDSEGSCSFTVNVPCEAGPPEVAGDATEERSGTSYTGWIHKFLNSKGSLLGHLDSMRKRDTSSSASFSTKWGGSPPDCYRDVIYSSSYSATDREMVFDGTTEVFFYTKSGGVGYYLSLVPDEPSFNRLTANGKVVIGQATRWNKDFTAPKYPDVSFLIDIRDGDDSVPFPALFMMQYSAAGLISKTQDIGPMPTNGARFTAIEAAINECMVAAAVAAGGGGTTFWTNAVGAMLRYGALQ